MIVCLYTILNFWANKTGVVLFISIATALVGPISFLGLIVANLSRQLFRTYRHTELIVGSTLFGIVLLIAGIAMLCFGVWRGEAATVLSKAIKLCLECVGIG